MAVAMLTTLIGFAIGIFLFFRPAAMIEIQRKFYAKINWRIEPISMNKELRNTKIMGLGLVILALAASVFLWANKYVENKEKPNPYYNQRAK